MKRLILASVSTVALLAAGSALAQVRPASTAPAVAPPSPTAPVLLGSGLSELGSLRSAPADCGGASNCASVEQNGGSNNEVDIDQTGGSSSTAIVTQDDTSRSRTAIDQNGAGPNLANVEQRGARGLVEVDQSNDGGAQNTVKVLQRSPTSGASTGSDAADGYGARAVVNVDQDGSGNSAEVRQGTEASLFILGNLTATNQVTNIDQQGDDNQARVVQNQLNAVADIKQLSDGNTAQVDQPFPTDPASGGFDNESYITQSGGVGNEAYTQQTGVNGVINTTQTGDGNFSVARQGIPPNSAVLGSDITVTQTGSDNESDVLQTGAPGANDGVPGTPGLPWWLGGNGLPVGAGDNLNATVFQDGDSNKARVQQIAGSTAGGSYYAQSQIADISQVGDHNNADIFQTDLNDNANNQTAKINQSGDYNTATIIQDGASSASNAAGLPALLNYAEVNQTTDNNNALIVQTGQLHSAVVNQ